MDPDFVPLIIDTENKKERKGVSVVFFFTNEENLSFVTVTV